jgi:hypothetical protein
MATVGGTRGIKSFFTLILNFFTLFFMLILIGAKIDPIKVTFIGTIFISFFSLFFINGFNKKTRVAIIRYWGQEAESILTYFPWINKFEYSEYEVESFKCYINNMIYELRDKEYKHSNWKKVRNIINLEVDDRFTLSYDDEKLMCQIYFQDDIFNHDLIMTVNEYRIWDKMNHNQYEYDLGKYFDEKDFLANLLRFKNAIISKIKNNINKWEKELDGFNLFKNKIITLLNKENIKIDDYTTSNKLLSFEYNNQIITMFTEIDFDYCNVKHNKTYEDNHIHIYKSDVEPFLKNETVILYSNSNWSIVSLWGLQREFRELLDINVPNLNNKYVVNLTFRSINEYVYLPRYDFVEFSRKAQQLLSEINKNKYKITDKYVEEQIGRQLIILDNMNYDSVNKAIEDKINKLIYPLICNIKNNKINVRLNCDFTKTSDGKFRPWLIKDFVEVLNQLGINAYNIK